FGIAKLINDDENGDDLTKTGDVVGTPNYMSPEQCLGRKVDTRSDVYALGCLLFYMISGRPPFSGKSTLETLMKHVNEQIERLRDVPDSLNRIIDHCTQKAPEKRYGQADEIIKDIESIQGGSTVKYRSGHRKTIQLFIALGVFVAFIVGMSSVFVSSHLFEPTSTTPISITKIQNADYQLKSGSRWAKKHFDGDTAHRANDAEKALKLYQQARTLALSGGASYADLAYINKEIGGCARYLNKHKLAVQAYGNAADYYNQLNNIDAYQKVLGAQARSEFALKDYDDGLKHYDEILKVQKERFPNNPILINYNQVVGKAHFDAGKYKEASRLFENAFEIARKHPGQNQKELALAHWYYGKSQINLGDKRSAIAHLELAVKTGRLAWLEDDTLKQIQSDLDQLKDKKP
ncbi:MAG: tetratricopeptide repeat protein, partial [Candidatus Obscuribacterales bacterium]|nr:tetratricopeptide repeat protein [Candidatus Obscuribacterales bacterium]